MIHYMIASSMTAALVSAVLTANREVRAAATAPEPGDLTGGVIPQPGQPIKPVNKS